MYFEKVSLDEFLNSFTSNKVDRAKLEECYNAIKVPIRSSAGSAGYDFFMPFDLETMPDTYYNVPTGIRWVKESGDPDVVLLCVPRSGLGTKQGFKLRNTIGVIDMDYCLSDNEGHIIVRFSVDEPIYLPAGKAFMQGIIVPFLKVREDNTISLRNGGFGSSDADKYKQPIAHNQTVAAQ